MSRAVPQEGLTDKQKLFVEFYLRTWSAAGAAIAAGYSPKTARVIGPENLSKPAIAAEIKARLTDIQMDTDEVLTTLTKQARGSIEDFGEVDKFGVFHMDLSIAKEKGTLSNVHKLKPTRYGYAIELYDAQAATVHIGKARGMFVDKSQVDMTLSGGARPIITEVEVIVPIDEQSGRPLHARSEDGPAGDSQTSVPLPPGAA